MLIDSLINKDFAWELSGLHNIRKFHDGVSWFEFSINSDWYKGDHNPQFNMMLIILNFKIFEFVIHNIHHVENIDET
jgi:hypothetical protein